MNLTSGQARALTSWTTMVQRCCDATADQYSAYGGRGIGVCKEWLDPWRFLEDMGERPEGMYLGRKDIDADYSTGNCQWQSVTEKNRNTRRTVFVGGVTQSQVAGETGLVDSTIMRRRRSGRDLRDPRNFKRVKLNADQVTEIKRLIRSGSSDSAIGRAFEVSHTAIRNIRTGKAWSDVPVRNLEAH